MKINDFYRKAKMLLKADFIENPKLESEILICFVLNLDKKDFILTKDSEEISENDIEKINILVDKRLSGESIAQIINKKYFFDSEFFVNENVLIPRPETELLIEIAFQNINTNKIINVLEIGVGSGIISIILSKHFPNVIIDGLEISKEAIEVAKINIRKHEIPSGKINLINSDFFNFQSEKKYDLIISNPPYIPEDEAKKIIKNKIVSDPIISLDGGIDGLDFYQKIKDFSENNLNDNGIVIFEHGKNQRKKIEEIFLSGTYKFEFFNDLNNIDRVILLKKNQ